MSVAYRRHDRFSLQVRRPEMDRHAELLRELDGESPPVGTYLPRVEAERFIGLPPPKFLRLVARGDLIQWRRYGTHPNRVWYRRAELEACRQALADARRTQREALGKAAIRPLALTASEDWLSFSDAAQYLGISIHALMQVTTAGRLTATRMEDRHRYRRADLDAFLAAREGAAAQ